MYLFQLNVDDKKKESNWFDVGIIKSTSCTVSSYYLPNGDLEKSELDFEVRLISKTHLTIPSLYNRIRIYSSNIKS